MLRDRDLIIIHIMTKYQIIYKIKHFLWENGWNI